VLIVITILQIFTNLLFDHPCFIVISLDFIKAFDIVSHANLLQSLHSWILWMLSITVWWIILPVTHAARSMSLDFLIVPDLSQHYAGVVIGPVSYVISASDDGKRAV